MTLDMDIMVALHRGEVTPAAAFSAQASRDAGVSPAPLPMSAPTAIALVPKVVIEHRIGRALVPACAARGIRLDVRECYSGYREQIRGARNVITWGMRLPHAEYVAEGRNVLFLENGLLCQRHGVYCDAGGYFGDSSIVAGREWERTPTQAEREALAAHMQREFGWEQGATHDPRGPVLVALQKPVDAPLRHYCRRPPSNALAWVIDAAAAYLPQGIPVILRPRPRHAFRADDYRIPDSWTVDRSPDPYRLLRQCRAVVTANSTLGIEALGLGLPVACLGRHVYAGSGAVLDCEGRPERLALLDGWSPDPELVVALLCAVLRRQISYQAEPGAVLASPQFQAWADRCLGADRAYAAAAQRMRARRNALDWDLLHATEDALQRCSDCSRKRHRQRIIDADLAAARGVAPILSGEILDQLRAAGLHVVRPDLSGYHERWQQARDACGTRVDLPDGDVVLGFVYGGHLGDQLQATGLVGGMKASGRRVLSVRHRNAYAALSGLVDGWRNHGRIRLNAPSSVGPGQHIQRLQRWFGLSEEAYPRPDIRLTDAERSWAAEFTAGLRRPIILLSTAACTNAEGYADMPWQAWADVFQKAGSVIQCVSPAGEPELSGIGFAKGLTVRQWFALFSEASAYVGTWAAGIHAAAAFGLESLVVTTWAPDQASRIAFPVPLTHILSFLYPQHPYGFWTREHRSSTVPP